MTYTKNPFEDNEFEKQDIETALEQMVGGLQDDGLGDDEEATPVEDDKKE